jgi:hypothetical protein
MAGGTETWTLQLDVAGGLSAIVSLETAVTGLNAKMNEGSKGVDSFEKAMKSVGVAMLGAVGIAPTVSAAVQGVVNILKEGAEEARALAAANRGLDTSLAKMGIANTTAKAQVVAFAESQHALLGISAAAIVKTQEELMIRGVGTKQAREATAAIEDYAAKQAHGIPTAEEVARVTAEVTKAMALGTSGLRGLDIFLDADTQKKFDNAKATERLTIITEELAKRSLGQAAKETATLGGQWHLLHEAVIGFGDTLSGSTSKTLIEIVTDIREIVDAEKDAIRILSVPMPECSWVVDLEKRFPRIMRFIHDMHHPLDALHDAVGLLGVDGHTKEPPPDVTGNVAGKALIGQDSPKNSKGGGGGAAREAELSKYEQLVKSIHEEEQKITDMWADEAKVKGTLAWVAAESAWNKEGQRTLDLMKQQADIDYRKDPKNAAQIAANDALQASVEREKQIADLNKEIRKTQEKEDPGVAALTRKLALTKAIAEIDGTRAKLAGNAEEDRQRAVAGLLSKSESLREANLALAWEMADGPDQRQLAIFEKQNEHLKAQAELRKLDAEHSNPQHLSDQAAVGAGQARNQAQKEAYNRDSDDPQAKALRSMQSQVALQQRITQLQKETDVAAIGERMAMEAIDSVLSKMNARFAQQIVDGRITQKMWKDTFKEIEKGLIEEGMKEAENYAIKKAMEGIERAIAAVKAAEDVAENVADEKAATADKSRALAASATLASTSSMTGVLSAQVGIMTDLAVMAELYANAMIAAATASGGPAALATGAEVALAVAGAVLASDAAIEGGAVMHEGGIIYAHRGWPPPRPGEVDIRALEGEGVVSRRGMARLGRSGFDRINRGEGAGETHFHAHMGDAHVHFHGGAPDRREAERAADAVYDRIMKRMKSDVQRGHHRALFPNGLS